MLTTSSQATLKKQLVTTKSLYILVINSLFTVILQLGICYTKSPIPFHKRKFKPLLLFIGLVSSITESLLSLYESGVDDNETIKIYRSGGADPEGNQPGDLYVTLKVCNLFTLKDSNHLKMNAYSCDSFLGSGRSSFPKRES